MISGGTSRCSTCPHQFGERFVGPDGNGSSGIMLVGDSPWKDEVAAGRPFSGAAGRLLDRILALMPGGGLRRSDLTIANTIWCKPVRLGWMDKPHPDAVRAIEHCREHLDELIAERKPRVIVPMGNVALRRICGISGIDENACYVLDSPYHIPCVPAYHPSYILRGKQSLIPTVLWSLTRAAAIARGEYKATTYSLLIDVPPSELRVYVGSVAGRIPSLFVDIETPESSKLDEEDLEEAGTSYTIVRAGFSLRKGTACSFPWQEPYISIMRSALERADEVVEHADNHYDTKRLRAAGMPIPQRVISSMWAWHWLQSDLPKGLGKIAPFWYAGPPWKHLNTADPGYYNALDNSIGMDCFLGTRDALVSQGRWVAFERHCIDTDPVLIDMGRKGLRIDRPYQTAFMNQLEAEWDVENAKVQALVPQEVKPRKYLKRPPKDMTGVTPIDVPLPDASAELQYTISNELRDLIAEVESKPASKRKVLPYRFVRINDFNVDSWPQIVALAKYLGIRLPPRESTKDSDDEALSTDQKTLKKYAKQYPVFGHILECRKRWKMVSTYKWKLDDEDRAHYTLAFHPSTWRLCVAEGTPIEIVRNLRINPDPPPIEKVKPGDWAYTYDSEGKLTVRKVVWVKCTGVKEVVRIHWEAGYGPTTHRGHVDVTPDHLVRLIDGSWKEAQHLVPYNKGTWKHRGYPKGGKGDSLMALHRGTVSGWGYSMLHAVGYREALRDNRVVYHGVTGEYAENVHHIDGDKLNDLPENLQGLSKEDHGHITGSDKWARETSLAKRVRPVQAQAIKELREHLERTKYPKPVPYCRYVPNNHRVMKVERLLVHTPVYDLEVEDTHNFIAGEICVHNSCRSVNMQTIPKRSDLARAFRRMIIASPGHKLIEGDAAAIEGVIVGHLAGSKRYVRLAKAGVHGWLTAALHGHHISLDVMDDVLSAECKKAKRQWPDDYEKCKRIVHGSNYIMGPRRIHEEYPEEFPTERDARQLQEFYFSTDAGKDVRDWQKRTVEIAHANKALENRFGLRHRFYSLYAWNPRRQAFDLGEDAKRAVAFVPQSAAAAIQRIVVHRLLALVPEARQWLCLLVHDAVVADVPDSHVERYCAALYKAMTAPVDELEGLTIGCEIKFGNNLAPFVAEDVYKDGKLVEVQNLDGMREWSYK